MCVCVCVCIPVRPSRIVNTVLPFKEQVAMMSTHGVIVSAHGAGLMNLMFAAPFSAVVEVYPFKTHHHLYTGLAAFMGLAHYPIHPSNGTEVWSQEQVRAPPPAVCVCVCACPLRG